MAAVCAGVHYDHSNELHPGRKHTGNAGAEVDPDLPLTSWDTCRAIDEATILPKYRSAEYTKIYA